VNYSYLIAFLGMRLVGTLEPKPGVEPTASRLNDLIQQQSRNPAKLIVRSSYHSSAASEWLAERANVPAVMLPATVGGTAAAGDLFGMYDDAIRRMLAAVGS
jgi:zinc/manganese transport system substrate-binding protein